MITTSEPREDTKCHFASIPTSQAYCDKETDEGGNVSGEYWLGLSKIYRLANSSAPQQLRVDSQGTHCMPNILLSTLGESVTDYTLHETGYSGKAGDGLTYHYASKFSTKGTVTMTWLLLVAHKDI